ncbi:MAG TPA: hypothetical protein VFB61_12640, partial [Gemmatimonadales bacterium]|nr:hypothetical protein [Gemmatimonadales bacterium]
MRTLPTIAALLASFALGCSGGGSAPIEAPEDCTTPVTVTPEPASISVLPQSEAQAHFVVSNGCPSSSGPWNMTASGAGAVASVGTPAPSGMTLD